MATAPRFTDLLRDEHRLIGEVLMGVEALPERLRGRDGGVTATLLAAIEFFSLYIDRLHCAKEERGLFPVLAAAGANGALDVQREQHEKGRRILQELESVATRRTPNGAAAELLERYLSFVRDHIATEEATVLELAERILSPEQQADVRDAFERIEEHTIGLGGPRVLLALAGALVRSCQSLAEERVGNPTTAVAEDAMRREIPVVTPDDRLSLAAERMEAAGAREIAVVSGDTVVGILTRTDLEPHRGHHEWTPVRIAMTTDPVTVAPRTSLVEVARLLSAHTFNGVPVVEDGKLRGMLTRLDLVRTLAQAG
jgi:CBS domain-containing protein